MGVYYDKIVEKLIQFALVNIYKIAKKIKMTDGFKI